MTSCRASASQNLNPTKKRLRKNRGIKQKLAKKEAAKQKPKGKEVKTLQEAEQNAEKSNSTLLKFGSDEVLCYDDLDFKALWIMISPMPIKHLN